MVSTNTTVTKSRKATKSTHPDTEIVSAEVASLLENTEIRYAPFSRLFISELNARIVPHTPTELRDYADSIYAVGLIHNLVVVEGDDTRLEVIAGGGRTNAIGLLVAEGKVDPDKIWIPYKAVPRELAVVVSMTENGKRKDMHPAEQIIGFRTLSAEGKTPAQIGDLLGYGSRHVQRMLKLAGLAPEILTALAKDELTTEHCHALALESSPERQLQVLEAARNEGYQGKPQVSQIRSMITSGEPSTQNIRFSFVGEAAFAESEIRHDLFSEDEGGFVDSVLLDAKVMQKLQVEAERIQREEGWSWSLARMDRVFSWGDDAQTYTLMDEPDPVYSQDEQNRLDELTEQYDALDSYCEESKALDDAITAIQEAGILRGWEDLPKEGYGVIVSLYDGDYRIQRGVMHKTAEQEAKSGSKSGTGSVTHTAPEVAEGIGGPLLLKMSSERTLAVQAALLQSPQKAVALLVWKLCVSVFHTCSATREPFRISITTHHSSLTSEAPTGKEGMAFAALMQEEARLKALLPEGWQRDFTTFFNLKAEVLMSLMTYCTACSIDGMQKRDEFGRKNASPLDALEVALDFHMRDWWQPTKENFFSHMQKTHIVAALNDAGMSGAASDAEKMKKGDAAELAQDNVAGTRWVPSWMCSADMNNALAEPAKLDSDSLDTTDHNPAEAA
jgi:ParB family chromosome partitioning protein